MDQISLPRRQHDGARLRILVVAHTTTFLTELSLFGRLVREQADAEVTFYCAFTHWTADSFAKACADAGDVCLLDPLRPSLARNFPSPADTARGIGPRLRSLFEQARVLLKRVAAKLPGVVASFVSERLAFAIRANEIRTLLERTKPSLMVLGGDMVGYDTSLFIKLAHRIGVQTLIIPSTMSNGLEQAEVYHEDANYHIVGWMRELIARQFPKWVWTHKGRRLFRCPPGRLLAMEQAGLAPPLPWIFNSGFADALAMESEAMIDYYVSAGLTRERMVLTGTLSDDEMAMRLRNADAYRRDLCRELSLDPQQPLILTALPPDFLYLPGGRPQCDFRDYRQLVDFWIDSLAELKDCNRVIALHPSVDVETMRYIERAGIRIGRWKTAHMVPLCDAYVTSVSSTIRWAIACGKPVLNYDVYRYRYTDFLGVRGVLLTEEQVEFRSLLSRLAHDADYRGQIARAQQSEAPRWGVLDGHVGERMLALVERMATPTRSARAEFAAAALHAS